MIQCAGQLNLMDLLVTPVASEPPILLTNGQTVYKVVRGDVEEYIVTGEKWICGENNRGYTLKRVDGCYDCTWNTSIGVNVFTDKMKANQKAEKHLSECEHILGKDIKAKTVVAYRYMYNDNDVINFYAALENGDVYFRYGSMYEHIGSEREISDFDKKMQECMERNVCEKIEDYQPEFQNMYKCKHDKWKYAVARYQYING